MEPFFYLTTKVFSGQGALKSLKEISSWGKKPLIVTGKTFTKKSAYLVRIKEVLRKEGLCFSEFSEVEPEPSVETVESGAKFCREQGCDCVIGFGGGSPMDVAKGIAVLATNEGGLREYFGSADLKSEPLPIFAIPTTAGTGSEVTRYAVVVDWSARAKKTVSSYRILPKIAIIDPAATVTLPRHLTAFTGMDAFSHAIEGYLSSRANPLSDIFAIDAMRLIIEDLPRAVERPDDLDARRDMMYAAMFAGFTINRTGTIIVHGIGYSLSLRYRFQHGQANALILPAVLDYLYEYEDYRKKMDRLSDALGGDVMAAVKSLNKSTGIPLNLKDAGLKVEDIEELTRSALVNCERSFKRLTIKMDVSDLKKIFQRAFG